MSRHLMCYKGSESSCIYDRLDSGIYWDLDEDSGSFDIVGDTLSLNQLEKICTIVNDYLDDGGVL